MSESFPNVVNALRAAAEPTRLRLLALLTQGELTVGEICSVLGQSQPRISRHLKLLCDVGLMGRFREEHWVYYRVPLEGTGHALVAQLTALIATDDPVRTLDQLRMTRVLAERSQQVHEPVDMNAALGELDAVLHQELGPDSLGELLDIATGSGRILRSLASRSTHAVGVDISTEALRFARKQTYGIGGGNLSRCVFRRGDMYKLPFDAGSFDTATLERVLAASERVDGILREAERVLRPGGRLCIVEDFELLAVSNANPLVALRDWLERAGLTCERLRPVDTHGVHLIVALARKPAVRLDHAA
ncbi:MAG TPA: metalloregulator ArsR/SmtB family transcription factor [Steroidobacteraceae bacterium]|nr:metalloregulator ArsR/SmtB family transcription factor [Steroidobacteraceae bacterium]